MGIDALHSLFSPVFDTSTSYDWPIGQLHTAGAVRIGKTVSSIFTIRRQKSNSTATHWPKPTVVMEPTLLSSLVY